RHTSSKRDWSSDVCSSDLVVILERVGTKMHCLGNIVNRDLRVWRAPDLRSALDQFDIGGVGFQELGGDLFQLIGQPASSHAGGSDRKSTRLNSSHVSISYA